MRCFVVGRHASGPLAHVVSFVSWNIWGYIHQDIRDGGERRGSVASQKQGSDQRGSTSLGEGASGEESVLHGNRKSSRQEDLVGSSRTNGR